MEVEVPTAVEILDGFVDYSTEELEEFLNEQGLAMTLADLQHIQNYFKNEYRYSIMPIVGNQIQE